MTEEAFAGLLADAKNYLDITWEDGETDRKLAGILRRGMERLDKYAGAVLDYEAEGQPRELLFDYARYARASALDEFETNYLHDILALHLDNRVREAESHAEAKAAR